MSTLRIDPPALRNGLIASLLVGLGLPLGCNQVTGADALFLGSDDSGTGGANAAAPTSTQTSNSQASTGSSLSSGSLSNASGTPTSPCEGVACSGLGSCTVNGDNQATCQCQKGYHAEGLECLKDESCKDIDCSGRCASCKVIEGKATCTCPQGFSLKGKHCRPDPNPCDNVQCGPDELCIPEHHCTVDPVCVPTCDCSNCDTCNSMDHFQQSSVLYCDSGKQGPATKACNKPCPSGWGCLPFSTPFCWPGQGCMSL